MKDEFGFGEGRSFRFCEGAAKDDDPGDNFEDRQNALEDEVKYFCDGFQHGDSPMFSGNIYRRS